MTDQIRSHPSKVLFQEAMRAYSAGAYRATTIILWTAVMHDLTDKLRILADDGDAAAQTSVQKVDSARATNNVRDLQSFENGLLALATTSFELLTAREATELGRLSDDRNICAHPSFLEDADDLYNISAEQARAHARLVVEAVLSQPPIVGKALVKRFASDMDGESWPEESLADYLRTRYFDRARSGVTRNIVAVAIKQAIRPDDGNNRRAGRCVAAVKAAAEIDEKLVTAVLSDVMQRKSDSISDDDLIRAIGAVGTFKATWTGLGAANITRSGALLKNSDIEKLIEERAFASGQPCEGSLAAPYASAIDRLTDEQLEAMLRKPYPRLQWVPRVLANVQAANGWRTAERAVRMALRVAKDLSLRDLEAIAVEFSRNSQFHEAGGMPQLIQRLIEETALIPEAPSVWRTALDAVAQTQLDRDTTDIYDYSEARSSLDRLSPDGP